PPTPTLSPYTTLFRSGVLGDRDHPEVPEHDVWRDGPELRFFQKVVEPNRGATKEQLGLADELLEVENTYRLAMPLSIYLNRLFPDRKSTRLNSSHQII